MPDFFAEPILNSPYEYPGQHWELDEDGQPTNKVVDERRRSVLTPGPKPKNQRRRMEQREVPREECNPAQISDEVRSHMDTWRKLRNPQQSQVTPATPLLLEYWRHHDFQNIRPFLCQVEAVLEVAEQMNCVGIGDAEADPDRYAAPGQDCGDVVLEHLKTSGVQQARKGDRIELTSITGRPGNYICAEGHYIEGGEGVDSGPQRRAGIFIGPEFGTVSRPDLVAAAREAGAAAFDILIACGFNFEDHATEFDKLGRIPVLKAQMNTNLHVADELKNTGAGNLFVVFGEPDTQIEEAEDDQIRVRIRGVDVFRPQTGEIESGGPDDIALWFIDTNYNEESFFVRHAYLRDANDPDKSPQQNTKSRNRNWPDLRKSHKITQATK